MRNHVDWTQFENSRLIDRYLTLMQDCLSGFIYEDPPFEIFGCKKFDRELRGIGLDWPSVAHTMVGKKRLANVRSLVESVLTNGVEGDLVETGVWRGGACILMRGVLDAYGVTDRCVWVADSFEGLPPPNIEKYPSDLGDQLHSYEELAVSLEEVRFNFSKYGLLDDQVKFLQGWFNDSLPSAPINKVALLRLDADMYGSTMEALCALYDKVSVGGYVIVDDYHVIRGCRLAVHDFLSGRNLSPDFIDIDSSGIYWKVLL